jgi:hypothetical protein
VCYNFRHFIIFHYVLQIFPPSFAVSVYATQLAIIIVICK